MSNGIKYPSKFPPKKSTHSGRTDSGSDPTPEELASKHTNAPVQYIQEGVESARSGDRDIEVLRTYDEIIADELDNTTPVPPPHYDYKPVALKVGIEETGLKFQIGHLCRPSMADVSYSLSVLAELGMLDDDLIGEYFNVNELFGEHAYIWRKKYIWRLVELLGVEWSDLYGWSYPYNPEDMVKADLKALACIWILMCWDWVVNPGHRPEPRLPGVYNQKTHYRTSVVKLSCPFCGKHMPKPEVNTSRSVRMRKFYYWLKAHTLEYHRWNVVSHKRMHSPRKFHKNPKRSKK